MYRSVSFQFIVPLSHLGWNGRYAAPGATPELINLNSVGPDYFATMRIPLYQGREFSWSDTNASGLKIILNASAAKLFFPGQRALGPQVVTGDKHASYEVVAVAGDTKYRHMRAPAPPIGYVPSCRISRKNLPSTPWCVSMGRRLRLLRPRALSGPSGAGHPRSRIINDG